MKAPSGFSLMFVALALLQGPSFGTAREIIDEQPMQIVQTTEARFPTELTARGIREGEVRAVMLVDADGRLADVMVTAFSHPEFAVALLNAVRSWEYIPARQNGEPTGQRIQITFNFQQSGAIVSMLPAAAIAASMARFLPYQVTSLVCTANELDRLPAVRHSVSPHHPGKSMTPPATTGSATIDFYIDSEGRPRMPVAMKASHVEFAVAAADALMEWRFTPPTYQGRPIMVRMVQEFVF
jgi:TonB family protein